MQLQITHHTKYKYNDAVFLEPHYLRFYPQQRTHFLLKGFDLEVTPVPSGLFPMINHNDFLQHQCWFLETHSSLEIKASIKVITQPFNPFGFFLDQSAPVVPIDDDSLLTDKDHSRELHDYIEETRPEVKRDLIAGVYLVLNYLNDHWEHSVRYEDDIHSASECFALRSGSCRDIAWMCISILRSLGIPSRFVSGYAYNPELGEGHELHAWVEFFAPGAGWLGIDPSAGIFTTDSYIPTAFSNNPHETLPVQGSFRGAAAASLETEVKISVS
jgi:transglutaminase-like putative cysteine protease